MVIALSPSLHPPISLGFPLQPSLTSAEGLRAYNRNRREGAGSPSLANSLVPVAINDLNLNDTIIQVT